MTEMRRVPWQGWQVEWAGFRADPFWTSWIWRAALNVFLLRIPRVDR